MKISKILFFKHIIDALNKVTNGKKTITGLLTAGIGVSMLVFTGPNHESISTTVAGGIMTVTGILHKFKKKQDKKQEGSENGS